MTFMETSCKRNFTRWIYILITILRSESYFSRRACSSERRAETLRQLKSSGCTVLWDKTSQRLAQCCCCLFCFECAAAHYVQCAGAAGISFNWRRAATHFHSLLLIHSVVAVSNSSPFDRSKDTTLSADGISQADHCHHAVQRGPMIFRSSSCCNNQLAHPEWKVTTWCDELLPCYCTELHFAQRFLTSWADDHIIRELAVEAGAALQTLFVVGSSPLRINNSLWPYFAAFKRPSCLREGKCV